MIVLWSLADCPICVFVDSTELQSLDLALALPHSGAPLHQDGDTAGHSSAWLMFLPVLPIIFKLGILCSPLDSSFGNSPSFLHHEAARGFGASQEGVAGS